MRAPSPAPPCPPRKRSGDDVVAARASAAFEAIYQEFAVAVRRTLRRAGVPVSELDDAAQDVFTVVFRRYESYAAERGALGAWIWGISTRIGAQFRERSRRNREVASDSLTEFVCAAEWPDEVVFRSEQRRRLQRALERLSPAERQAVVRVDIEGETCEEVARAAAVPVGTVWSRVHAARAKFAAAWMREGTRAIRIVRPPSPRPLEPTRAFV